MTDDLSALSELFIRVAFAGYVVYAALMIGMVFFGRHPAVPLWFFELYRHALRSFFWYSLAVAVIFLCVFWLYFFGVLRIEGDTLRGIFALLHDLDIRRSRGEIVFGSLVLGSIAAFFGPLLPYAVTSRATGHNFKRRVLAIAARRLSPDQELEIVSLRPRRSGFGPELVRLLVAANKIAMDWIARSYSKSEQTARRFTIDSFNEDRMKLTDRSRVFEFWETTLMFHGEIEKEGRRKPYWHQEIPEIIFDGMCIRLRGVFEHRQPLRLLGTGLSSEEIPQKPIRTRRPSSLVASILEGIFHDSTLIQSQHYTLAEFQANDITENPLEGLNENLRFVGINNRDLYLFVHTGLGGNLFEFHLTEKVADSIRLFEKDLAFVQKHIKSAEDLLPKLGAKPSANSI